MHSNKRSENKVSKATANQWMSGAVEVQHERGPEPSRTGTNKDQNGRYEGARAEGVRAEEAEPRRSEPR